MPWIVKDRIGERCGKWTILERAEPKRPLKYKCQCDCGNICILNYTNIQSKRSTMCMNCSALSKSQSLIGKKFHHLTILCNEKVNGKSLLKVKCDCGNITHISSYRIHKEETPKPNFKYISCGKCILSYQKPLKHYRCMKEGFRKGSLTIIKEVSKEISLAICDCGNKREVKHHHMKVNYPSCGCHITKINIEKAKKLEGTTYFYLKVMKFIGMGEDKRAKYLMKCKCGTKFEKSISHIFGSKSCGCLQKEMVPKGEKNKHSKYTNNEILSVKEFLFSGAYSLKEVCEMMGMNKYSLIKIIKGKQWASVSIDLKKYPNPPEEIKYILNAHSYSKKNYNLFLGKKFGCRTIIELINDKNKNKQCIALCDCGSQSTVAIRYLIKKAPSYCNKCRKRQST